MDNAIFTTHQRTEIMRNEVKDFLFRLPTQLFNATQWWSQPLIQMPQTLQCDDLPGL